MAELWGKYESRPPRLQEGVYARASLIRSLPITKWKHEGKVVIQLRSKNPHASRRGGRLSSNLNSTGSKLPEWIMGNCEELAKLRYFTSVWATYDDGVSETKECVRIALDEEQTTTSPIEERGQPKPSLKIEDLDEVVMIVQTGDIPGEITMEGSDEETTVISEISFSSSTVAEQEEIPSQSIQATVALAKLESDQFEGNRSADNEPHNSTFIDAMGSLVDNKTKEVVTSSLAKTHWLFQRKGQGHTPGTRMSWTRAYPWVRLGW
jgi:hypothetical protein